VNKKHAIGKTFGTSREVRSFTERRFLIVI